MSPSQKMDLKALGAKPKRDREAGILLKRFALDLRPKLKFDNTVYPSAYDFFDLKTYFGSLRRASHNDWLAFAPPTSGGLSNNSLYLYGAFKTAKTAPKTEGWPLSEVLFAMSERRYGVISALLSLPPESTAGLIEAISTTERRLPVCLGQKGTPLAEAIEHIFTAFFKNRAENERERRRILEPRLSACAL